MTASLRRQAEELLLIGQERAAHILTLEEKNREGGRHTTPPEVIALKRLRLDVLRRAYWTIKKFADETECGGTA